jgi:hypothetical protein
MTDVGDVISEESFRNLFLTGEEEYDSMMRVEETETGLRVLTDFLGRNTVVGEWDRATSKLVYIFQ